jgi:hypothetical protein
VLTGQECERSRRQQALHCGHSGKSLQRGRRVATGLRGYGACEAAEGVVQKSGAKDESSRSGTLTFNRTHASERGAVARKSRVGSRIAGVRKFCRISFHTGVQHVKRVMTRLTSVHLRHRDSDCEALVAGHLLALCHCYAKLASLSATSLARSSQHLGG